VFDRRRRLLDSSPEAMACTEKCFPEVCSTSCYNDNFAGCAASGMHGPLNMYSCCSEYNSTSNTQIGGCAAPAGRRRDLLAASSEDQVSCMEKCYPTCASCYENDFAGCKLPGDALFSGGVTDVFCCSSECTGLTRRRGLLATSDQESCNGFCAGR
jgi:hypothetical protein